MAPIATRRVHAAKEAHKGSMRPFSSSSSSPRPPRSREELQRSMSGEMREHADKAVSFRVGSTRGGKRRSPESRKTGGAGGLRISMSVVDEHGNTKRLKGCARARTLTFPSRSRPTHAAPLTLMPLSLRVSGRTTQAKWQHFRAYQHQAIRARSSTTGSHHHQTTGRPFETTIFPQVVGVPTGREAPPGVTYMPHLRLLLGDRGARGCSPS